jgi:hypothetical protein
MSQFNIKTISNLLIIFSFFFITLSCKKDSRDDINNLSCDTKAIETQFATLFATFSTNPNEKGCNNLKSFLETSISKCAKDLPQNIVNQINVELAKLDCASLIVSPVCNPETIETQFTNLVLAFVTNRNATNCNKLKTFIETTISTCLGTLPKDIKDQVSAALAGLDCSNL